MPKRIFTYTITALIILLSFIQIPPASAQEPVRLDEVTPNSGAPGEEIGLELMGSGFGQLTKLTSVLISGIDLPILDTGLRTNDRMEVFLLIPEETPLGVTEIRFVFEQVALDAYFIITEPRAVGRENIPAIHQISPQDGELDTEFELSLQGDFLYELGELVELTISGREVPFWDYSVESDQSAALMIYLPSEHPTGKSGITLVYGNYDYEDSFIVTEPSNGPSILPIIIVGVLLFIGVVVTGSVLLVRNLKKPEPPKETLEEDPTQPGMTIRFKVDIDPGKQRIETEE